MDCATIISPQRREEMEMWLKEHPVDHRYDDSMNVLDGGFTPEESLSRYYEKVLKENPEP